MRPASKPLLHIGQPNRGDWLAIALILIGWAIATLIVLAGSVRW